MFDIDGLFGDAPRPTWEDPWKFGWKIYYRPATYPRYAKRAKAEAPPGLIDGVQRLAMEKTMRLAIRRFGESGGEFDPSSLQDEIPAAMAAAAEELADTYQLPEGYGEAVDENPERVALLISGWDGLPEGQEYSEEDAVELLSQDALIPPGRAGGNQLFGQFLCREIREAAERAALAATLAEAEAEKKSPESPAGGD